VLVLVGYDSANVEKQIYGLVNLTFCLVAVFDSHASQVEGLEGCRDQMLTRDPAIRLEAVLLRRAPGGSIIERRVITPLVGHTCHTPSTPERSSASTHRLHAVHIAPPRGIPSDGDVRQFKRNVHQLSLPLRRPLARSTSTATSHWYPWNASYDRQTV
jgi:hypothetical protein